MKKITTLVLIIIFFTNCNVSKIASQTKQDTALQTEDYAGVYSYKNGGIGYVTIFAETDNTVLFHICINIGPKSYNSGETYGRILIKDGKSTFTSPDYTNCKWELNIIGDTLKITTIDDNFSCGFGYSVTADGTYTRSDKTKPEFFEDRLGQKIYFSKTSPEDYYKK